MADASSDLSSIQWEDPTWPYPLNRFSVLSYFERSPFFDPASVNMEARRRGLDPAMPGVLASLPPGNEFVVDVAQEPNLFVILQQQRGAQGATPQVTAVYYVLDRRVYRAPVLHSVIMARMTRALHSIRGGVEKMRQDLDPLVNLLADEEERVKRAREEESEGKKTQEEEERAPKKVAKDGEVPAEVRKVLTAEEKELWKRTDAIIINVLRKYPKPRPLPQPGAPGAPAPGLNPPSQRPVTPRVSTPLGSQH